MRNLFFFLILLFSITELSAQVIDSLNQTTAPKGGINRLALRYYGIDFSEEQRKLIGSNEIELMYLVDAEGNPTLSEVNGINDPAIIDSLRQRTLELDSFHPAMVNGVKQESIYFMKMSFPTYKQTNQINGFLRQTDYKEPTLADFEYIDKSNVRFDMLIGGMMNQFIGNPATYLGLGGGMKIDMTMTDKRQYIYGLTMSFYGNKRKEPYPLETMRPQFSAPPTLLVGAVFGKWFDKISIQGEINYTIQNITERIGDTDPDWIQLRGWSPGVVVNYPILLGKEKPTFNYGGPSVFSNNLNIHLGFRYLKLSLKEATGFMVELGVGYRMGLTGIKSYKMKSPSN